MLHLYRNRIDKDLRLLVEEHTEGLVLKVLDFQDYDQMMVVFTPHLGIVKWIIKKYKSKQQKLASKITPITLCDFTYTKTKTSFWKCKEVNVVNLFIRLREKLDWLETAGKLIQIILQTQEEQSPSLEVYQLLLFYLKKIPEVTNQKALYSSFKMKILKNEGLINTQTTCASCQNKLISFEIFQGEHYCKLCAPFGSCHFSEDEFSTCLQLAACRSLSELEKLVVSPSLEQKIAFFSLQI